MNMLTAFGIEFAATLLIGILLVSYIRRSLFRVLVDLCGTEDRARFWLAFSTLLLLLVPAAAALGYRPLDSDLTDSLFLIFRQLSQNIMGFVFALVAIGLVIGFFALVAPRTAKESRS